MNEVKHHSEPNKKPLRRRRGRRWLRALLTVIATLFAGVIVIMLLARSDTGRDYVRRTLESRLSAAVEPARVSIQRIDGNVFRRADIYGVRVTRDDGSASSADLVSIQYRPIQLVRRRIVVDSLKLVGLHVDVRQLSDTTWDVAGLVLPSEGDGKSMPVSIRNLLVQGSARAEFLSSTGDSTLVADSLLGVLTDVQFSDSSWSLDVASTSGAFQWAGFGDRVQVYLEGSFASTAVAVDSLSLRSFASNIHVSGDMKWDQSGRMKRAAALVAVEPVATSDLRPVLPWILGDESIRGTLSVYFDPDSGGASVDVAFADGGRLGGTVQRTERISGGINYVGSVELVQVNPALVVADVATGDAITAALDFDMAGPGLASASGAAILSVSESRFRAQRVRPTDIQALVDSGLASINGRVVFGRTIAKLRGNVRPFDVDPSADLQGELSHFDASDLLGMPRGRAQLDVRFRLAGVGRDPATADWTVMVNPAGSRLGTTRWTEGLIQARIDDGELAVDIDGELVDDGGSRSALQASAMGPLTSRGWTFATNQASFRHIDLGALVPETLPRSDLTGSIEAFGHIAQDSPPRSDLTVTLGPGSISDTEFQSFNASAALDEDRAHVKADAGFDVGHAAVDVFWEEADDSVRLQADGAFRQLDLRYLSDQSPLTMLNGSFAATMTGLSLDALRGEATVTLDSSRVHEQTLLSANAQLDLRERGTGVSFNAVTPQGGFRAVAEFETDQVPMRWTVTSGVLEHVDVGRWLPSVNLTTDLNGRFSARGRGSDPDSMDVSGFVVLEESRVNDALVKRAQITGSLLNGQLTGSLYGQTDSGSFSGSLEGRPSEGLATLSGRVELTGLDIAAFLNRGDLRSRVSGTVEIQHPYTGEDELAVTLHGRGISFGATRIDSVLAVASLGNGLLQVDSFWLQSNVVSGRGTGSISLDESSGIGSDLEVVLDVHSLAPLRDVLEIEGLSGEGTVTLHAFGKPGRPRFGLDHRLQYITYEDLRLASLEGELSGRYADGWFVNGTSQLGFTSGADFSFQESGVAVSVDPDRITFSASMQVDRRRNGSLSGYVDLTAVPREIVLEEFFLRLEETNWQLSQNARITAEDAYYVRQFLLYADDQQIAIDGALDFDGEQNLVATAERVRVGGFADLFGYVGLNGVLDGWVVLTGPSESPEMEGSLDLTEIHSHQRRVGDFHTDLNYSDFRLDIAAAVRHVEGSYILMDGYFPADISLSREDALVRSDSVNLSIRADSFNIDWIQPFIDPDFINRTGGLVTGRLDIGGIESDLDLKGEAHIVNGFLGLPEINIVCSDVNGYLRFDDSRAIVESLRARSGGGSLAVTGSADFTSLSDADLALSLDADAFRAISTETYRAVVDGDLELGGSIRHPTLTGNARLEPMDVYLTEELLSEELEPIQLTERDLQTLERRFGYRVQVEDTTSWDFYRSLEMDVDATVGRDAWIRSATNPKMDIEFSGDVKTTKEPNRDAELFGSIRVTPTRSTLRQYGKRFRIQSGEITFNGPFEEAVMDLRAVYRVPARQGGERVAINLGLSGRSGDLELELTSDPQLDPAAIVSYLILGRPPSETFLGGASMGEAGLATNIAVGQLSALAEGFAGSELGLDVVEIEANGLEGATVTMGKYVSPLLYAALSQPISLSSESRTASGSRETSVSLEYRLFHWMLLNLAHSKGALRFNVLWEWFF